MEYPQRTKTIKLSSKDFYNNEISVVLHDGVVSVGQKRILDTEFQKAIITASEAMEKLAVIIENSGAVIGHIKAFIIYFPTKLLGSYNISYVKILKNKPSVRSIS